MDSDGDEFIDSSELESFVCSNSGIDKDKISEYLKNNMNKDKLTFEEFASVFKDLNTDKESSWKNLFNIVKGDNSRTTIT
ncbi:MAG: hypothetical protein MHPSP_000374, partial [Paramarteilia canceri]